MIPDDLPDNLDLQIDDLNLRSARQESPYTYICSAEVLIFVT